jgi:hypothetical protein
VRAPLPLIPLAYLGVYEPQAPGSYAAITEFGRVTGRQPNIALYYSRWSTGFETAFADDAHAGGAIPYVQVDPNGVSLAAIARGKYDAYLRGYADAVADYRSPVIIGFAHDMNAPWYSWGYGKASPATFIRAWRHIVRVFQAQNADNVTWLWTVTRISGATGPIHDWWPGARYVTWVGVNGFYSSPRSTFNSVFAPTIAAIRKITGDPVLLSQTAVGPLAQRARGIKDLFNGIRKWQLLGLVWFDEKQDDGVYHQDWRLENNQGALTAFRAGTQALRHLYRPS